MNALNGVMAALCAKQGTKSKHGNYLTKFIDILMNPIIHIFMTSITREISERLEKKLELFRSRNAREILKLVVTERANNAELAARLGIKVGAVKNHLTRIFRELKVKNRDELFRRFETEDRDDESDDDNLEPESIDEIYSVLTNTQRKLADGIIEGLKLSDICKKHGWNKSTALKVIRSTVFIFNADTYPQLVLILRSWARNRNTPTASLDQSGLSLS